MADNAEIKLGADAGGLKSGMSDAERTSRQTLANIANYLRDVASSSQASVRTINGVLADLRRGFVDTEQQAGRSTRASGEHMSQLSRTIIRTAAAALGAWVGHKAIESVYALEDAVEKLERGMGITSEQATHMAIALKLAGSNADAFVGIAFNIGRVIKTDSEEFARLGVKIKDASGNLLPMEQIMRNTYERMLQFKAGTDQNLFALATAGRSAKEFGDTMENLARVQERATAIQKAYGLEMGEATQGKIKAFKTEIAALGEMFTIAATKVAIELLPVIKDLGQWFVDRGPAAINAFISYIELLRVKFEVMSAELRAFTVNASAWYDNMVVRAQKSALSISMTINGQIDEVPAMWGAANARIKANNKSAADQVVGIWDKAQKNIAGILAKPAAGGGSSAPKSGSLSFEPKTKKGPAESGDISGLENELKAERDAYNKRMLLQGSFEEWSLKQTRDYWEAALALTSLTSKQRMAVENKYYDAERALQKDAFAAHIAALDKERESIKFNYDERIRLAQQAATAIAQRFGAGSKEAIAAEAKVTQEFERQIEQRLRLADVERRRSQATAEHGATMDSLATDQKLAMQEINAQQAIALEQRTQERLYQIKLAAYQKELALERDPVKIAALNAQIEQLEQEHQERMTRLQNDAMRERAAASLAAANSIREGLSSALQQGMQDWRNWRQAGVAALKTVADAITKMVADQWVKMLLGPGTTGGGFLKTLTDWFSGNTGAAAGGAGAAGGAAGGVALEASATALDGAALSLESGALGIDTSAIGLDTAGVSLDVAATQLIAAAASLSAAAASSAASGMAGGIGDLFGSMMSFAVGTPYVPQDTLAVVHKGEAIVPAKYNGGSAGQSSGGAMGAVNMSFHISGPIDTRTQGQIYASAYRGLMAARARNT